MPVGPQEQAPWSTDVCFRSLGEHMLPWPPFPVILLTHMKTQPRPRSLSSVIRVLWENPRPGVYKLTRNDCTVVFRQVAFKVFLEF